MHSTLTDLAATGVSLLMQNSRLLKPRFAKSSDLDQAMRLPRQPIDLHCPGQITLKGAVKRHEGPAAVPHPQPTLPKGDLQLPGDEFPFSNR
ncbi:MAG: hypothetical protein QM739_12165 [Propionivibrio sp.]